MALGKPYTQWLLLKLTPNAYSLPLRTLPDTYKEKPFRVNGTVKSRVEFQHPQGEEIYCSLKSCSLKSKVNDLRPWIPHKRDGFHPLSDIRLIDVWLTALGSRKTLRPTPYAYCLKAKNPVTSTTYQHFAVSGNYIVHFTPAIDRIRSSRNIIIFNRSNQIPTKIKVYYCIRFTP